MEPVYDFWNKTHEEHTFHCLPPWGPDEEAKGVQFYAFETSNWEKFVITNLKFDLSQALQSVPSTVHQLTLTNGSDRPQTTSDTFSLTDVTTKDWSQGTALEVGVSATITCGVPLVASGTITMSAAMTETFNWGQSVSHSVGHSVTANLDVPGHKKCTAKITVYTGTIDVPYTMDVEYQKGGFRCQENVAGKYHGVSTAFSSVTYSPFEDA